MAKLERVRKGLELSKLEGELAESWLEYTRSSQQIAENEEFDKASKEGGSGFCHVHTIILSNTYFLPPSHPPKAFY
jgi:hypothetical protein